VEPLALSVCDGQHASIIAYGQTGSGKTYTMNGYGVEYGMSYRILNKIFEVLELRRSSKRWKTRKAQALARKERYSDKDRAAGAVGSPGAGSEDRASGEVGSAEHFDFSVSVSMLEIYNETIRDLLLPAGAKRPALEARLNASGDVHVPHLSCVSVAGIDDVFSTFEIGQSNRATAVTNLNEHSSRSHSLLIVSVNTYMVHKSVGEGGSSVDVGASAVGTNTTTTAAATATATATAATANDDSDAASSSSAHCTTGKLFLVDLAGRYM
jgi:kinesin family protein C2/C3